MKIGIFPLVLIAGVLVFIVGDIPSSFSSSHPLLAMTESERLAGSPSDTGNLMILEQLDSEVILPNQTFDYFFKRLSENFEVVFEFNQEKKADLLLKISDERKREVRISEERGIIIPENIVREQRESVEEADRIIQRLERQPAPDPALRRSIIDRINNSFDQAEVSEIRKDFQDLRNEDDRLVKQQLAESLDERLNDRTDVRIACFGGIDSLSIAIAPEPVRKIRENCPVLNIFPEEEIKRVMEIRDGP